MRGKMRGDTIRTGVLSQEKDNRERVYEQVERGFCKGVDYIQPNLRMTFGDQSTISSPCCKDLTGRG